MSTDDDLSLERLRFVLFRQSPVQPSDPQAEGRKPFAELAEMLLGQDFGRRHHRGLPAGVGCGEAGDRGDDGLAAAHVALQKPLHRVWFRHVAQHFVHGASLCAGQLEGQLFEECFEERAVCLQCGRSAGAALLVRKAHRQLLREELVEFHAPPRRCRVGGGRRPVQKLHAVAEPGQAVAAAQPLGQRVLQRPGVQRIEDASAQRRLREPCGRRVDRRQALRQRLTLAHEAVARVRHLGAEPAAAHFAEGAHAQAFFSRALELLQLAAIEIEKAQDHAIGVHDQLAARPVGDFGPLELRLDEHRPSGRRAVRRGQRRPVLVAQRQVKHEVEARAQPELVELACAPRRLHPECRMASISTSAPRGSPETPTAARAGNGSRTYCAMISLTRAKCARSVR